MLFLNAVHCVEWGLRILCTKIDLTIGDIKMWPHYVIWNNKFSMTLVIISLNDVNKDPCPGCIAWTARQEVSEVLLLLSPPSSPPLPFVEIVVHYLISIYTPGWREINCLAQEQNIVNSVRARTQTVRSGTDPTDIILGTFWFWRRNNLLFCSQSANDGR